MSTQGGQSGLGNISAHICHCVCLCLCILIAIAFVFADILGEGTTRSWEEKLCTRRCMLFLLSDKGVNLFSFEFQEAGMCYGMQELVEEIYAGRGEDLRKVPHRLAALKIYERSSKC